MQITAIADYCKMNIPGVVKVEYLPSAWVDMETYEYLVGSITGQFIGVIEPIAGRTWLSVGLLPAGRAWDEQQVPTAQGTQASATIAGIARGLRPDVAQVLLRMTRYRYLVRWKDKQGKNWLVGSVDTPLDFSFQAQSGEEGSGLAAYSIRFSAEVVQATVGADMLVLS